MSLKYKYLADKGVKVAALSCNALGEHQVGLVQQTNLICLTAFCPDTCWPDQLTA